MGSQCTVSFNVKNPYFAYADISRKQIYPSEEEFLIKESLSLNPGEQGAIDIHFELFKLEVFTITIDVFEGDEGHPIHEDSKIYTVSSVADFIFFVLSLNASGYFDIINSRPDAFDIIKKIPYETKHISKLPNELPKLKRFCSVKNTTCNIEIKFRGSDSYFLAYPFDKDRKWHRLMTKLKNEFSKKGLSGVLPTDKVESIPESGILFCNICEKIISTNSIIGEITVHNRNVMFEMGYAIGMGRVPYFLVEKETKREEPTNFDLKRIDYTSLNEILDTFSPSMLHKELPLKRPPTITKSCCEKEIHEYNRSVFLLIPNSSRHQEVLKPALIKQIENLDYKIITPTFGHAMCNNCESILKSEYVVGDFVSDNIENSEILNIEIAFYLGLAVGLGKKVIILQEKPHEKRMIDMTGLIKEYVDSDEAQQIVRGILLPHESLTGVTTMAWLDSYNKRKTEPSWIDRKNKVLKCLKGRELNYKQIIHETKLEYPSVIWMLRDLEHAKVIKSRSVDGNKLYSINDPPSSGAIL